MKHYYTLIQSFQPEHDLQAYLDEQGIYYKVGADFAEEFFKPNHGKLMIEHGVLLKKFTVLIEEHELSAIMLSVDGVQVVDNRNSIKFQNTVRGYFSWILK